MIKCVVCGQEVTSKRGLSFHIKKHNIESVDKYLEIYPEQVQYVKPKDDTLLTCPICGRYNMKQLGQHIVGTHKMTHEEFLNLYPDQKMFIEEISERCRRATAIGLKQYYKNKEADPEKYARINKAKTEKRKQNNPDIGKKVSEILRSHGVYDRMSERVKNQWNDPEYRKMQSDKAKKQHENGLTERVLQKSGKKRYEITLGGNKYSMRSTWETRFAEYLFSKGVKFLYEPFVIKYEYNGKIRSYYPDFTIENTKIVFEVKPKKLINEKINILKKEATIKNGYEFIYVTEDEIEDLDNFQIPNVK